MASGFGNKKNMGGYEFENFGSHCNKYPVSYLTCAAAIGVGKEEVDLFLKRFEKVLEASSKIKMTQESQVKEA